MAAQTELLEKFAGLRQFQQRGQRAPHKPLLVLLALARVARGESRMTSFVDVEKPLSDLLSEFGPPRRKPAPEYPFWHLRTDKAGALWEVDGPPGLLDRPAGATPTKGELRKDAVSGGFSEDVDAALRRDPQLRARLAQMMLDAHFPESLHADIRAAIGLPEPGEAMGTAATSRRRDPAFRENVLRAYGHRCAVCGLDLRIGKVTAAIEAAHIKWFQADGPDVEANGLALCSLHHKVFDMGGFTVTPARYRLAFSEQIVASERVRQLLLVHHGEALELPQRREYFPAPEFLHWHREEVFKGRERELTSHASGGD